MSHWYRRISRWRTIANASVAGWCFFAALLPPFDLLSWACVASGILNLVLALTNHKLDKC